MKQDIAKVWVEELRSGKYKQGGDFLCKDDHYCCLGVLCEIYNREVIPTDFKTVKHSVDKEADIVYYGHSSDVLPYNVQEWAGMVSDIGSYYDHTTSWQYSLSELNDGGHSFNELADIIEHEYDQL